MENEACIARIARAGFFAREGESLESLEKRLQAREEAQSGSFPEVVLENFEKEFGIRPTWIDVAISTRKTNFLQPALTEVWSDPSEVIACVYLSKRWLESKKMRDEILPHELIHAIRAPLEAVIFEEFAAYGSTSKGWRALMGPIFTKDYEPWLFLIAYFASLFCVIFSFFWVALLVLLSPFFFFGYRYFYRRSIWNKAKKNLAASFGSRGGKVLFFSSDEEIVQIAKMSLEECKAFIKGKMEHSLRWKQLKTLYF